MSRGRFNFLKSADPLRAVTRIQPWIRMNVRPWTRILSKLKNTFVDGPWRPTWAIYSYMRLPWLGFAIGCAASGPSSSRGRRRGRSGTFKIRRPSLSSNAHTTLDSHEYTTLDSHLVETENRKIHLLIVSGGHRYI